MCIFKMPQSQRQAFTKHNWSRQLVLWFFFCNSSFSPVSFISWLFKYISRIECSWRKFGTWIWIGVDTYCVCVKRITLCNCLCSRCCCFSASLIRNIGEFGAKIILQTMGQLIQYVVLEIHFWSLKYTVVMIRKNLSNFPFKRYEAINDSVLM